MNLMVMLTVFMTALTIGMFIYAFSFEMNGKKKE